uniref:Uncharacterized protein n=1 Tax=Oryza sativa subsp. japonica TaxID=39947 RepID=Q5Z636_ORYSJ|nr:hypothetical protein [Oryza sativa Japonica Group]
MAAVVVYDPAAAPTTTPPVSSKKTPAPAAVPTTTAPTAAPITPATPALPTAPTTLPPAIAPSTKSTKAPVLAPKAKATPPPPPLSRSRLPSPASLSTILRIPAAAHAEPPHLELRQPASLACSALHSPDGARRRTELGGSGDGEQRRARQGGGTDGWAPDNGGSAVEGAWLGGSGYDEAGVIRCRPSSSLPLEVMRTLARQASPPPLPLLYSSHVILTPHQPEASARLHPHHQHLHATHSLLAFSTSAN